MPRRASTRFAPEDVARMRLPSAPQISPDGRRIVYVETVASLEHDRNHQTLVCIDVETRRSTPLAPGLHADRSPTWTPDSKSIVFVSDREGGSGLWRIRPGDRAPAKLAVFQGQARQPRVSPDGRFVAFLFQRAASGGGEAAAGTRKLYRWAGPLLVRRK